MHKRMGCKAQVEVKYRSNLLVVRILTKPATKQTAFYAPRQAISTSTCAARIRKNIDNG